MSKHLATAYMASKRKKKPLEKRMKEESSRSPSEHSKGVHEEAYSKPKQGQSNAGSVLRQVSGQGGGFEKRGMTSVKDEHKKRLSELKDMPKAKFAKGGKLKLDPDHHKNAHLYESDKGTSKQGSLIRSANRSKSWAQDQGPVGSSSPSIERSMAKDRMSEAKQVQKTKPRLAEGGPVSAKSEKRPSADEQSAEQLGRNRGDKPAKNDSATSNITVKQAQRPSVTKLSQPKMVGSDVFSVRNRDMHDDEADMMDHLPPQTDRAQPVSRDDEKRAASSGHKLRDMQSEHSTGRKPYNKAIEDQYAQDMAAAEMKKTQSYARGGAVMQPEDHDTELMERDDEAHLMDMESPSEDEGSLNAHGLDEEDPDTENPNAMDMEREHNNGRKPYAGGGMLGDIMKVAAMAEGGEAEQEEEHHDSIAAAIMARRKELHDQIDSGAHDLDEAVKMAEGGEVNGMDSIDTHEDADQADLSRNAEEDANMEDQTSFNALRKENYSESEGLDELDSPKGSNEHGRDIDGNKHDMVESIRRKMNSKRQFNR